MSSEPVLNIVFIGSTGAGKSSTCNTLYRTEADSSISFPVSHDEVSCTKEVTQSLCRPKNINLIDCPAFGDNRYNDRQVSDLISQQLSSVFSTPESKIDAFALVVRLTPRAQTLKRDLEQMKNLFGHSSLKSMILLLIYSHCEKPGGHFLENLEQMQEVSKLLKGEKEEEPNEDWFCVWDNVNPREGQEEELMEKINKLAPYTRNDFLRAQEDTKFRKEAKGKIELEGKDMGSLMEELEDQSIKIGGSQTFSVIELEDSLNRIVEAMEDKMKIHKHKIDSILGQNQEMLDNFMNKVEDLEGKDKNEEKNKRTKELVYNFFFRRRKLGDEEIKELTGTVVEEGTEKTVKAGSRSVGRKIGEKIGKLGAEQIEKQGTKLIKDLIK